MKFSLISRAAAVALLTAFVTLSTQILIHRMVSAKLLNNYAFLLISLTMLGFAFSGVILSRSLSSYLKNLNETVTVSAALFAITTVGASAIFYQADIGTKSVSSRFEFILPLLSWIPIPLWYAIPFACFGGFLVVWLSSPHLPPVAV